MTQFCNKNADHLLFRHSSGRIYRPEYQVGELLPVLNGRRHIACLGASVLKEEACRIVCGVFNLDSAEKKCNWYFSLDEEDRLENFFENPSDPYVKSYFDINNETEKQYRARRNKEQHADVSSDANNNKYKTKSS